ncbi:hypothetical protein B566_EDAN004631 [Ephemera danica]|nr:hypothetical protein B566_EDAN004631 [Ephemera danica]
MKSSKKIEINRSTLVSLKAELCRKQEEVSEAKVHSQFVRPTPSAPKKPNIWDKKNPGVDGREERDFEEIEAENNALKRSRSILEAKAELYDKLSSAGASKVETLSAQSVALVDFRQKQREDAERRALEAAVEEEEEEEGQYDSDQYDKPDNSDDEWRCLRKDIEHLKTQDSKLAGTLGYINTKPSSVVEPPEPVTPRAPTPPLEQRLVSGDMQREALRAKWEQEQTELLKKDDVHYQDILYDEN